MKQCFLIIGLGNPGKTYEDTRHNIGYRIIKAVGSKYGMTFKPSLIRAKGSMGEGRVGENKVRLLLPLTYMNDSGASVKRCSRFYKIPVDHLIVVTDDVALPLGQIRLRAKGTPGGHNGLKSVQAHLGTDQYPRLRVGVGDPKKEELADYVLGRFTQEEQQILPEIVDRSIGAIELWMSSGIEAAMQEANRSK